MAVTSHTIMRYGAIATAFLIPLKLSLTYIVMAPLIVLWVWQNRYHLCAKLSELPKPLVVPLVLWLLCTVVSSCFGIYPVDSLVNLTRFIFSLMSIVVFFEVSRKDGFEKILVALLTGQAIAAIHTIGAPLFMNSAQVFLGSVTESGQLALTLIIAIGLSFYKFLSEPEPDVPGYVSIFAVLNLALLSCLSFFASNLPSSVGLALLFAATTSILATLYFLRRELKSSGTYFVYLLCIVAPLLAGALLINLKRGPWSGVCLAAFLLLARYYRKLVIPAFLIVILIIVTIAPIRERLIESSDDFFIAGGRNIMWQIGAELSAKYPLGIGFKNSSVLQKFDPSIASIHTHFHNNYLNILVETGWLGLIIFIWWIFSVIKAGFKNDLPFPDSFFLFILSLTIISWQTAGLVEYNFGDSEVIFVVYVVLAVMGALLAKRDLANPDDNKQFNL